MSMILGLDISGTPRKWLNFDEAITYHAKEAVAWSIGDPTFIARGGYQKDGTQSIIHMSPIIAIRGTGFEARRNTVPLTNFTLFGRDRHTCAYCGQTFRHTQLSRDHVIPKSRKGADTWMNCVTACKWCNCKKDDFTPEEADMPLLFLPYVPVFSEKLILENRRILGCQMDFLQATLPKHSRVI
jgi:hypothetical protein